MLMLNSDVSLRVCEMIWSVDVANLMCGIESVNLRSMFAN